MGERPIPVRLFRAVEWVADSARSSCAICRTEFSWTTRRHHCRLCGEVVCAECSPYKVFIRNEESLERTCKTCYDVAEKTYQTLEAQNKAKEIEPEFPPQRTERKDSRSSSLPTPPPLPPPSHMKPRAPRSRMKSTHKITIMIFLATLAATALQYEYIGWVGAGMLGLFIVCMEFSSLGVMLFFRNRNEKARMRRKSLPKALPPGSALAETPRPKPVTFQGVHGAVERCQEFEDTIQRAIQMLLACSIAGDGQDGWKRFSVKSGVELFFKNGDSTNYYMGKGVVDGPPRAVLDILGSDKIETNRELDEYLDRSVTVKQFNFHTSVVWNLYKPVFPMSARDFLMVLHQQVQDDGSLVFVAVSIDDFPGCPVAPGTTRGTLYIGGWHLIPLPDNKTQCIYVSNASLGGSVPVWLINKVSEAQPLQIAMLNKMMKKRNLAAYAKDGPRAELRNGIDLSCPVEVEKTLMLS